MYSIKVKANMKGHEIELTFSHNDPDVFYRKMFSLFEWVSPKQPQLPNMKPMPIASTGEAIPLCPYHSRRLKESTIHEGYWYCTAKDSTGEYCEYTQPIE